jgi:hypothetical protein
MKTLFLLLLSVTAYGQAPSPISNTHILVYPAYGKLAEIKPDIQFSIPFDKKESYKEIVFHRTQYDTAAEYELLVTLKKKGTVAQPEIEVKTIDAEQATFSSNWGYHGSTNATGWLNNTISFSNVAGSTVTHTFTGTKIEVYGETLPTHGTGTVKIDNQAEVPISFKSTTKVLPAKVFEKELPNGQHTIVIKVSSGYNLVDYFKVYSVR